jgi:hypothetical protein
MDLIPLERKSPKCLKELKKMLTNAALGTDLVACSAMFGFIPESITRLESNSLTLHDSLKLLNKYWKGAD